jgi:hypothetical protein
MAEQVALSFPRPPVKVLRTLGLLGKRRESLQQAIQSLVPLELRRTLAGGIESILCGFGEFTDQPARLSLVELLQSLHELFSGQAELVHAERPQQGCKVVDGGSNPMGLTACRPVEVYNEFTDRLLGVKKVEVFRVLHTNPALYTIEPRLRT